MLSRERLSVDAPVVPAYRPFAVTVTRLLPLGPHLVRVTFSGPDLRHLATTGLDQQVKLLLPLTDGSVSDVGAQDPQTVADGSWYARWRELPGHLRNPMRTYTVRYARPERCELDVDMVLHDRGEHPDGPATCWLRGAAVGDRLVVVAPDSRCPDPTVGTDWRPGAARHLLLAGDETAAPAICAILETLPAGLTAQAFIEVATGDDILNLVPRGASRLTWLARDAGCSTAEGFKPVAPHGLLLTQNVQLWLRRHMTQLESVLLPGPQSLDDTDVDTELLWDSPLDPATGDFYAWVAGEAATVRTLRRHLVQDVGVARTNVAFMGYWRAGRAEAQ
jgi:NADPH-dependent ferric siderophore reductase